MRSPLWTFLAGWSVLLVLTLYAASDVHALVLETPWLENRPWALDAAERWLELSERSGLDAAHDAVAHLRGDAPSSDPVARETFPAPASPPAPLPALPALAPALSAEQAPARRVLLIGASSMQFALGSELERLLETRAEMTVLRVGKASTGLARNDVYDWLRRVPALLDRFKPDLMIGNFGGNDAQGMVVHGAGRNDRRVLAFGTPEWDDEYAERMTHIIRDAQTRGARVVMLGMPIMRQPAYSEKIRRINGLVERATTALGALYLSSWEISSTGGGQYRRELEWNGKRGPMRLPDGHHYTPFGGQFVAAYVMSELDNRAMLVR